MTKRTTVQATLADALTEGISEHTFNRRWRILAVLCLSLLTVMIANMSLNLALPELALALNMTQLQMTWSIEAYTLIFATLLFITSAIADRYGRKLAMQIGLFVFALASLYAAFIARSGTELIAARLVMGVGGAFVIANDTIHRQPCLSVRGARTSNCYMVGCFGGRHDVRINNYGDAS
ncbi:MFS transporter [Marinomonas rhodophyticola]|uniref:MFS transporter n=1 Tax=Marinomonas rhodophyticola TaxID=2992803 RepID=A0ABT3KM71_9GAMM|nr:MFS transporter [Marinomonas sp. KJ51-3]MCW4631658.1 MFS transporter [Marinomonas sp. KJ51-3]